MEKKQRVPKGEKYYHVFLSTGGLIDICQRIDYRDEREFDDDFKIGNYFYSYKEAQSMVKKLRAVLKGAEVIEMPSEEERKQYEPTEDLRFRDGWMNCYNWLRSKIVK